MWANTVRSASTQRFGHGCAAWGVEVAARDFDAAERRMAADVVGFGTRATVARGLDALRSSQWEHVWPAIEGFGFDADDADVWVSPDGGQAVIGAAWHSLGRTESGETFPAGRASDGRGHPRSSPMVPGSAGTRTSRCNRLTRARSPGYSSERCPRPVVVVRWRSWPNNAWPGAHAASSSRPPPPQPTSVRACWSVAATRTTPPLPRHWPRPCSCHPSVDSAATWSRWSGSPPRRNPSRCWRSVVLRLGSPRSPRPGRSKRPGRPRWGCPLRRADMRRSPIGAVWGESIWPAPPLHSLATVSAGPRSAPSSRRSHSSSCAGTSPMGRRTTPTAGRSRPGRSCSCPVWHAPSNSGRTRAPGSSWG